MRPIGLRDYFKRRRERESAIPNGFSDTVGQIVDAHPEQDTVQVPSSGNVIDLRGTGLREEILGLMREHGIDAKPGSGQQIDASSVPGLQEKILETLRRHGAAPFGSGGPW